MHCTKPVGYIGGSDLLNFKDNHNSPNFREQITGSQFMTLPIESKTAYFEMNISQIAKGIIGNRERKGD